MGRGEGGTGVGIGSAARAKDVVAVRMALFPETVMFNDDDDDGEADLASSYEEESAEDDEAAASAAATQKSIVSRNVYGLALFRVMFYFSCDCFHQTSSKLISTCLLSTQIPIARNGSLIMLSW